MDKFNGYATAIQNLFPEIAFDIRFFKERIFHFFFSIYDLLKKTKKTVLFIFFIFGILINFFFGKFYAEIYAKFPPKK